jgi:hypothetical protein
MTRAYIRDSFFVYIVLDATVAWDHELVLVKGDELVKNQKKNRGVSTTQAQEKHN